MGVSASISLGIAIAGFIATAFWKVVDLSVKFGRMTERLDDNQKRDDEFKKEIGERVFELTSRMNRSENNLSEITAMINNVSNSITRLEDKVDRLVGGVKL